MEATGDAAGLLGKIVPPRLEDAGLEDCALPPESIKEAFLKAATAVRSRIFSSSSDEDESDVNDPWTGLGDSKGDKLVGITPEADPPGACAAKKGGDLPEWTGNDVVVPGVSQDVEDKVVSGLPEVPNEGEACVDELDGLHIGEKQPTGGSKKTRNENDGEEKEGVRKGDKPILVEGFV